jgi:hypothetical protein
MIMVTERLAPEIEQALTQEVTREYPSMSCGLNVAQYRALKSVYTVDKEIGRPPAINIVSFANGVGKTHLLVLDMVGWTLGPGYLDWRVFPPEAIAFYRSLDKLRDAGKLSLRVVCTADDAKEGGSVIMILKEMFPTAYPTAKDQSGCYRQINVPHPKFPDVMNFIAVKTFDQAVVKHSGSTCQRVWINEPIPEALVGETVGRIRSKKGEVPGSILMCATLVEAASWVEGFENDPAIRLNHQRGHIYENCKDEDITDEMAAEVSRTIGTKLEKMAGGGYVTGGVLDRATIEVMCAAWRERGAEEYEARKCGAPVAVGGKVYPTFRREVHVVENYKFNPDWPTFMVADPHSAKPTFVIWAQLTPMERLFVFDEWPGTGGGVGNYEDIKGNTHTIPQECEAWSRIEASYGMLDKNIVRIGDPNRFNEPDNYTGGTLRDNYVRHNFRFNTNVSDDLDIGHREVLRWLYYDELRYAADPNNTVVLPKLFIVKKCVNVVNALRGYSFKMSGRKGATAVSEKVDAKYKDGADVVRYLVMWASRKSFETLQNAAAGESDYKKFCEGRNNPKAYMINAKKYGVKEYAYPGGRGITNRQRRMQ